MKKCNKCKKNQEIENFINKTREYKTCLSCREITKKWRDKNKERISKYNKLCIKKKNNGKQITIVLGKKIKDDDNSWVEYSSQKDAATKLNIYASNINKVIKGKLKQTGGYIFKTINKINNIKVETWEKIKKDNNYINKCKGNPSKNRILHEVKYITNNSNNNCNIIGKKCCNCKEWKPLTNYNFSKSHWDKLRNDCKDCLKIYRKINRRKIQDTMNIYEKKRKLIDPCFKLSKTLRSRIGSALKAIKTIKSCNTMELTGCDLQFLKTHLEKQFTEGMSWNNHGEWHIDHIIPLASAKTRKELIKLFHYSNLQPLWEEENRKKSAKILYGKEKF